MTDLEMVRDLFSRAGVRYEEATDQDGITEIRMRDGETFKLSMDFDKVLTNLNRHLR